MSLRGGRTDEMRQLASQFDNHAGQIGQLIQDLNAQTTGSMDIWKGPAADRFRSDWESYKPTLDKLVQSLHEASQAINQNAENIDMATQ